MCDANNKYVKAKRSDLFRRNSQSGYSLLMVVFLVATALIFAAVVTPNLLTEGRRERETETVWRGEQYERAIGLYFKKFGKYPTKIEDLTKQTNGVRFLRHAYTDPMNKEDGSWRFIYVGPNGQLIGSLHQTSLLQGLMSTPILPGASSLGAAGGGLQALTTPDLGAATGAGGLGAGQAGQQANGTSNSASAPNPLQSQPQPLEGDVVGGNIIGVGSKIKKPSIRIYDGGDTYQQWEFIWNPNSQVAIPGQNSANPVPPPGQAPAQTPQVPGVNAPAVTPPSL